MALSNAQKLLVGVGATAGIGYGAYYATQMKEVSKLEKDKLDIVNLITNEKKKLVSNKKLAEEADARIVSLSKQSEAATKALKDVETKLEAARKQVAALEAQYRAKQDDIKKFQAEMKASQSKLAELQAESERAKESVTMGEKSLVLASQKVESSKQLLNPLNHPRVKSLLGRK